MEGFFNLTPHPSGNSSLVSYFHSKNWAFETPLPLRISINLPWGGHGYFLELHNQNIRVFTSNQHFLRLHVAKDQYFAGC